MKDRILLLFELEKELGDGRNGKKEIKEIKSSSNGDIKVLNRHIYRYRC